MRLPKTGLLLALAGMLIASGCSNSSGNSAETSLPPAKTPSVSSPSAEPTGQAASPSGPAETGGGGAASSEPPASQVPATGKMGEVTALRLADDRTGWAGGEGWIARTDDGGATWNQQYSEPYQVVQIFALNDSKVWATLDIGSSKGLRLIHSSNGGKSWSEVGVVPNRGFLHFLNDNDGFVGNARTKDGGATWIQLKTPENTVGDVYFHDLNNGWAVQKGKGKFTFLHSADGGKSWTKILSRETDVDPTGVAIRSTGKDDAWIEVVGDTGMNQTSYSLFHTKDGGMTWTPAIAKDTAGGGPAPGFTGDAKGNSTGTGSKPGQLYAVNPSIAFMGGDCPACDNGTSIMATADGGNSWTASKQEFSGYGEGQIAAVDAKHVWLIATDYTEPSVLYTSDDGGVSWKKIHEFDKPDHK
ncbi:YCF48-related protein [Cohnella sp. AR92]|uniref:YCF48-related protein n=1 Tax=Cohnella sp. AR92 TaxID=648716 RepID=UPI001EDD4038|nr:YCF48-related protein [Cohnella sp. AR92]